jgi:glycosyltransferase involved in cell wall biosynthesis
MSAPLLSIVMPSYNQGRFLPEALDSIFSQSYRPLEVIVVDGASSDDSCAILAEYAGRHPELRWISERDQGPADAVNKGLAMMRGELAGICSSDDLYCAGALEQVVRAARAHPDCGFIYGDVAGVDEHGTVLGAGCLPEFSWPAFFAISLALPQGSIFFRAKLAREIGGWNASYYSCDIDYWLRMLFRTRAIKISAVLSHWRMHDGQRTRLDRFARLRRDYARMIEESPDLRRASAHMRRMARASVRLWALIDPQAGLWSVRRDALAAWLLHPSYPLHLPRQRLLPLIPGWRRSQAWLARLRRPRSATSSPT